MIAWSCNMSRERSDDYDEACQHEEACREKKHRSVHPFFFKEVRKENIKKKQVATSEKPRKESVKMPPPPPPSSQDIVHLNSSPEAAAVGKQKSVKQPNDASTTRTRPSRPEAMVDVDDDKPTLLKRTAAPSKKSWAKPSAPLAGLFSSFAGAAQLMAEHRAAEFISKRPAEADRERERQKRRRENANMQLKGSAKTPSVETTNHGGRSIHRPSDSWMEEMSWSSTLFRQPWRSPFFSFLDFFLSSRAYLVCAFRAALSCNASGWMSKDD